MNKKILGIDIQKHSISAVLLDKGHEHSNIQFHIHNIVSDETEFEETLSKTLETVSQKTDIAEVSCIVSIPADEISYRNIEVPFNDQKKISKILAFELESSMPFPVDDLIIDFKILKKSDPTKDTPLLVAAVEKSRLKSYLDILLSYKLDPGIITISGYAQALRVLKAPDMPKSWAFADIREDYLTLFVVMSNEISFIRSLTQNFVDLCDAKSICLNIEHTISSFEDEWGLDLNTEVLFVLNSNSNHNNLIEDMNHILQIPVKNTDIIENQDIKITNYPSNEIRSDNAGNAVALTLLNSGESNVFNFRKHEFALKNKWGNLKNYSVKTGILGLIVIILALSNIFFETHKLDKRISRIDNRITEIFTQTFPNITRIVDPLQQMRVELKNVHKNSLFPVDTGTNTKVIDILNEISKSTPAKIDVKITRLNISAGSLLISGNADTFNAVNSIKSELDKSKYFKNVQISSATQEKSGERINFKLKTEL